MGIIIIGPHPKARVVGLVEQGDTAPSRWAIIDDNEVLGIYPKESHAHACLPLIQSGE